MSPIASIGFLLALLAPGIHTEDKPKEKPRYETRRIHDPNGIGKFYMDREIAQVMGHLAAGWLERPEREKEEQPAKLMEALQLKPGDVVADIGAGSGYFTFRLAEKVGPKGKVLAVEIQQEMLDIIKAKMKKQKVDNIGLVLGTEDDPKLKENSVDLILLVDVYHEFSFPYEMTQAMVKALKPGGRLVFVEYRAEPMVDVQIAFRFVGGRLVFVECRAEDTKVPIKEVHKMSKKQVIREMGPHALKYVKTVETLPWQHILIFEKKTDKSDGK